MHLVLSVVFGHICRHHEAQGSPSVGQRGTCIWRDIARACSSSCSSDASPSAPPPPPPPPEACACSWGCCCSPHPGGALSAVAPLEPEAPPATSRSSDERGVLLASVPVRVDGCCHYSQLPCSTLCICNPAGTSLQTDGAHDLRAPPATADARRKGHGISLACVAAIVSTFPAAGSRCTHASIDSSLRLRTQVLCGHLSQNVKATLMFVHRNAKFAWGHVITMPFA